MRDLDGIIGELVRINDGVSRCFVRVSPGEMVSFTALSGNKTVRRVGIESALEVTQLVHSLRRGK